MLRPARLRVAGAVVPALAIGWLMAAGAEAAEAQASAAAGKREFNIIPVAGGDSDIGTAVGQLSSLARLTPGPDLYSWRLESGTFISFKLRDEGVVIPVHDYYLQLTLRDLGPGGRIRLDVRARTRGARPQVLWHRQRRAEPPPTVSNQDKEYGRNYPERGCARASACARTSSCTPASVFWYDRLDVRPNSILAMDATSGPTDVRSIIGHLGAAGRAAVRARC